MSKLLLVSCSHEDVSGVRTNVSAWRLEFECRTVDGSVFLFPCPANTLGYFVSSLIWGELFVKLKGKYGTRFLSVAPSTDLHFPLHLCSLCPPANSSGYFVTQHWWSETRLKGISKCLFFLRAHLAIARHPYWRICFKWQVVLICCSL